jgi:hypothetical protein
MGADLTLILIVSTERFRGLSPMREMMQRQGLDYHVLKDNTTLIAERIQSSYAV